MTLRFHADEHVPRAVVAAARRDGIDITSPRDADLLGASDEQHLAFATQQRRVLVTNDRDFTNLHARGIPHAGILYLTGETPSVGSWLFWIRLAHACYEPDDFTGRFEYVS